MIGVFSEGLKKFPNSYKLYRYRGRHLARNYQFGQAISDYHMALELIKDQPDTYEPNGIPNALDLTISTFKQNIPYYLGQTSMATWDYETVIKGMDEAINVPVLFAYIEEFTGSMRNSAISLAGFFIIGLLILVSSFFIKTESSASLAKD